MIKKNRPNANDTASNLDGISDNLSVRLSTVGVHDVGASVANKNASGMANFIKNMAKTDKELYEKLVDLMRYFNLIDIDMRLVSQLKACFM